MRVAKSTEPRVETNVGCKPTFLKAAWASLVLRGPVGNTCQESLWRLHLSGPVCASQWQASRRFLR